MKLAPLFVGVLFLCHATQAVEPEPDWSNRFQDLKQAAITGFQPPQLGQTITVCRRIGGDLTGKLDAINRDSVTVDGKVLSRSSLTPETAGRLFADAYAAKVATERLKTERHEFLLRKEAEQRRLAEEQRAKDQEKQRQDEEDGRIEEARGAAEEKIRLDFKGLLLGMTQKQVEQLIQTTEWDYQFAHQNGAQGKPVFLCGDSRSSLAFRSIGSEGSEDHKTYYRWRYAFVQFHHGRILSIEVASPKCSADYIDSELKDWLHMAYTALVNKYGKPQEVIRPIDEVNIFSFKTGFGVFLYKWLINDQRVVLSISEDESQFSGGIDYLDMKMQEQIDAESKTETHL